MSRRSNPDSKTPKASFKLNDADAVIVTIKEHNVVGIAQCMADAALRCGVKLAMATTSDGYMRIWGMHKNMVTWGVHWRSDWHQRCEHKVLYIENALLHQKLGVYIDHMGYFGDSSIVQEPQPDPTPAEIAEMKTHCKQAFPWRWFEGGDPEGPIMVVCQTHNDTSVRWHNFPDRNGLREGSITALLRLCAPLRDHKVIVRPHPKAMEHFKDQSKKFDWPGGWSVDSTKNVYETLRECSGLVTATSTLATEALSLGIPVACLGTAAWHGCGAVMECSGNPKRVAGVLDWKPDEDLIVKYLCAVMRHQLSYKASVEDILDNESFCKWIESIGGSVPAKGGSKSVEVVEGTGVGLSEGDVGPGAVTRRQIEETTQFVEPRGLVRIPEPRMCVVVCAWGDDEARLAANRKAMTQWRNQTIQPYVVLVEALDPDEDPKYSDLIPEGAGRHVILEHAPWRSRGIALKEALQEIGAKQAPETCEVFAFVDGDVWSESPQWFEELFARALEGVDSGAHALVQGFRHWRDSEDDAGMVRPCGVGHAAMSGDDIKLAQPGMCWAMSRRLWADMGGLNHRAINGSGDLLLVHELASDRYKPWAVASSGWLRDAVRPGLPKASLVCVRADIVHEWHGDLAKRAYVESWQAIDQLKTPVDALVKLDESGIPVWINPDCRLASLLDDRVYLADHGVESAMKRASLLPQVDPAKAAGHMGSARACRRIMDGAPRGARVVEYGAGLGDWSAYLATVAHNAGRGIRLEVYDSFDMLERGDALWRLPNVARVRKPGEMTTKGICRRKLARTGAEHVLGKVGRAVKLAEDQKKRDVWSVWLTSGHEHPNECLHSWWDKIVPGGWLATHAGDKTFQGVRQAFQRMALELDLNLVELDGSLLLRKPSEETVEPACAGKSVELIPQKTASGPPPAPAPSSRPAERLEDTALILNYANGEGSELRRKATEDALEHLLDLSPAPLVVFHELVFPGREPQFGEMFKNREHTVYICISGTERNRGAWSKEALYELAVKMLPKQCIHLIFGDADMYPDCGDFAARVRNALAARNVLLQAYSSWSDTRSARYTNCPSFAAAPAGRGSPGGYWAMRRELHARLGGFCTTAFAGGADSLVPRNWTSESFSNSHIEFKSYRSLIKPVADKPPLECLDVHMTHVFHGEHVATRRVEGSRAYEWRYWVTDLDGRDIRDIVEIDKQGLPAYIQPNDSLQYCMLHKADMFSEESARATYAKGLAIQQAARTAVQKPASSQKHAYDQAWWIANPAGGMGSAMRGAVSLLEKTGERILVADRSTKLTSNLIASSPVWVLGGLPLKLHDLIRAVSPEIEIILQCHSPWLFLANEKGDFSLYMKALDLCSKHPRTNLAHVAEREYRDACAAFGEESMRLIPAIYEGGAACDPGEAGGPVVVAHQARPGKNLAGQLLAGAQAASELGVPLHWHCPSDLSRASSIIRVWSMIPQLHPGLEAVVKGWVTQKKFRTACREASVGMCASWTDAYSQVACDFLSQGTPIVASHAQWFCRDWSVWPDDVPAMSRKAVELVRDPDSRAKALQTLQAAQTIHEAYLELWRKSLE